MCLFHQNFIRISSEFQQQNFEISFIVTASSKPYEKLLKGEYLNLRLEVSIQIRKMASCSGGQPLDESESDMDYSEMSDSDFLESETDGKKAKTEFLVLLNINI